MGEDQTRLVTALAICALFALVVIALAKTLLALI